MKITGDSLNYSSMKNIKFFKSKIRDNQNISARNNKNLFREGVCIDKNIILTFEQDNDKENATECNLKIENADESLLNIEDVEECLLKIEDVEENLLKSIITWEVKMGGGKVHGSAALLLWCKQELAIYPEVSISNMSSDWRSGKKRC